MAHTLAVAFRSVSPHLEGIALKRAQGEKWVESLLDCEALRAKYMRFCVRGCVCVRERDGERKKEAACTSMSDKCANMGHARTGVRSRGTRVRCSLRASVRAGPSASGTFPRALSAILPTSFSLFFWGGEQNPHSCSSCLGPPPADPPPPFPGTLSHAAAACHPPPPLSRGICQDPPRRPPPRAPGTHRSQRPWSPRSPR